MQEMLQVKNFKKMFKTKNENSANLQTEIIKVF